MKHLASLNKYFVTYKWHFVLGIVFTIASNYFGVQMPKYVKQSIDELQNANYNLETPFHLALMVGGWFILLSLGKGLFLFFMRQTIIVMSRRIEYDMKNEIFKHYLSLDSNFFKQHKIGDLMNRISEDVSQVRMYLGPGVMYSLNLIVLTILSIYQMMEISVTLTLYTLIPLPVLSLIIYKVSNRINRSSKEMQEELSNITTIVQESITGIRIIKAYDQFENNAQKLSNASESYKRRSMQLVRINALFMPAILLLIGLCTLLMIWIGGGLTGSNQLSLGAIVAFLLFVNNLTWPFVSIGWVTSIIQRAEASQQRINEFLKTEPTIQNVSDIPFSFEGNLELRHVGLFYQNTGITGLDGISFQIEKGDTVGITGKTGSGKSSIVGLITRQFDPSMGIIFVDGKNLKEIHLEDFRKSVALVPQEVFLFSDTIRNNVTFGSLVAVSDEEIIEVLKLAHVWHNIEHFPQGLDTQLGELGINLSGGQKQRINIARALIRKPKLLILDDCLSAVDTETENIILHNLAQLPYQPTIVMVGHRISSLGNCRKIIALDQGKIIEMGNPEELMQRKGFYYDLVQQQNQDPTPIV